MSSMRFEASNKRTWGSKERLKELEGGQVWWLWTGKCREKVPVCLNHPTPKQLRPITVVNGTHPELYYPTH